MFQRSYTLGTYSIKPHPMDNKREYGFYWVKIENDWIVAEWDNVYAGLEGAESWYMTGSEIERDDNHFDEIDEGRITHWTEKPTGVIVFKEVGLEAYEIIASTCLCHIDENNKETYLVGNQWFRLKLKQ
jgi:hypothetical protein